ncbi:MAG: glucose 1-dehydrogenase [Anaerolineae bacterium]|nr:glucose 1-dehydrogenase [Anaerolineae bacterium]
MQNRVAIVTGAARGIGAAAAHKLASLGAKVALVDIDVEPTRKEVDAIRQAGGTAHFFRCDVSIPAECDQLVRDVVAQYGKLDILVNNAGICPRIPIDEMTEASFDRMIGVNLKSVFFLSRAAANAMKPQKWGRVINITSTAGRIGAVHRGTVYSATKGAVQMMTKSMAREYAADNILMNCIAPGAVDTRMFDIDETVKESYIETVPLKRLADPAEVAAAIVHLCAEDMSWVTGATLDVNGGVVMV